MQNKLDLIKEASNNAPLKREAKVKTVRVNQSFYIDADIADLVASFKKGALSKAVKTALLHADTLGLLNDFKEA